jgi:hypothetical protein
MMESPHVDMVDRLDDGVVFTFSNGRVLFFSAAFLWANRDKSEEPYPPEAD